MTEPNTLPDTKAAAAAMPTDAPAPAAAGAAAKPKRKRSSGISSVIFGFLFLIAGSLWLFFDKLPPDIQAMAKDAATTLSKTTGLESHTKPEEKKVVETVRPAVTVLPVTVRTISEEVVVSGSLVARTEVLVAPEVEGLAVQEILVDEGDAVRKGDLLVVLNKSTLEMQMAQNKAQEARAIAAIAQAETGIAQAQATKVERDRALQRTKSLKSQGFASTAQLDQNVSSAKVSDAQLDSSKKSVDVAEADRNSLVAQREDLEWRLARTEIRAPADGVISRKNARVGQIGTGQGDPMFKLIVNGEIEFEADVADIAMPRLQTGMKVDVTPNGARQALEGKIRLIRPEIDAVTRLGKVRVSMGNDQRLIIGSSARGLIQTGSVTAVAVPLSAISFASTGNTVQVIENDTVRVRKVKVGLLSDDSAEIVEGLAEGDVVVAKAGTFLKDGDKIKPMPMSKDPTRTASQTPSQTPEVVTP